MHSYCRINGIQLSAIANTVIRRVGLFLSLLMLSFGTQAALDEVNGNNPYTLNPAVSVGSYYDIVLQIKNNGSSLVNLTSVSTTGPFTLQWNGCGTSLAPGAACGGNIGIRFTPTAVGTANGSLVVGNDGPDGPFTLNLLATGTSLLAPTLTAVFSPNNIYSGTGASTLTLTLANPNAVSLIPTSLGVNLPNGFQAAANPNPTNGCGGGNWFGPGNGSPANQQLIYFTGGSLQIPATGSCAISIDVVSTNAPGTYTFTPQPFATYGLEVWSAMPVSTALTVITPIPGAPGAPTIASVTGGNAQVTVTFAPPSDTGGSPITGYTVTSKPMGGVDSNADSTGLSHIITGLSNGTAYTFVVTATNTAGSGVPSAPSAAVTPLTPVTAPGVPTNAIATAGNGQAIVTFSIPNDGGSAITGFTVTSNPAGGVDSNAGSVGQSHKITGLDNGTDYTFTVIATNALGASAPSAASNRITPAIPLMRTALPQMTYQVPQTRSLIATPTPPVTPGPRVTAFVPTLQSPRIFEFVDLNGDGYLDIIATPHFPQSPPQLPLTVWLNRGDGTFYDGTAEVIDGGPIMTWGATQILVGDFNSDGRPDIFFISSGPEFAVADGHLESGSKNTLLLSQPNGKYKDATAQLPSNPPLFNHMGGVGDANGDGNLDIVVNAFRSTLLAANGIRLYYGDGKGNFTDATGALPSEIRYMLDSDRPGDISSSTYAYQLTGCATLADLDGDGRAEVITGSYSGPDGGPDHTRTIRFHKLGTDGKFVERGRVNIPDAIANIDYGYDPPPAVFRGLGCSQIVPGDINGDGRTDLLVQWEGAGKTYVELLRNDGNFQFTDITLDALGSYNDGYLENNTTFPGPGHYRLMDVDGDGTLDIVSKLNPNTVPNILQHAVRLNDGSGHFTPWVPQGQSGALTSTEVLSAAKCTSCSYMPFVFDTNRSGMASLVLLDFESLVTTSTPSQTTAIYLTTFAPTATAVGVPQNVIATAGNASVSIAFKAYDGGTAATGFTATCTGGPTPLTGTATASPIVVTGMSNGTSYSCSVKANNSTGSSIASTIVAVTPAVQPLSLNPSSLSFAAQVLGTSSAAQTVTLGNTGTNTLSISSIATSGDFSGTTTCGSTMDAGATCTISVIFTPTAVGTRIGAITISSNAVGSPHSVSLTGTTVSPVSPYDGIYQWDDGYYLSVHQIGGEILIGTIYWVYTGNNEQVGARTISEADTFDLFHGQLVGSSATMSGTRFYRACTFSYDFTFNPDSSLSVRLNSVSNSPGVSVADVDCAAMYTPVGSVWTIPRIY